MILSQEEKDRLKQGINEVLLTLGGSYASMSLLSHATELKAKIDADLNFQSCLARFFSETASCVENLYMSVLQKGGKNNG